ncbi:energy transducer TonB [Pseudomonas sp. GD03860]|uniref:energy transducer TonB n=1 Tax=Pseudomonas TaxID=286 RepID=UPI0023634952|nr:MULTISPECIES: energy transducer TonB [Pseudomonas]MDD2057872.1 energy transducer TonB [Pseudomonas putida]MDH0638422.1 energy transducer TonB [Pseudomonas sp. GD03860]
MKRLAGYLLLSVALHSGLAWLLHDREARSASLPFQPAMAIQWVSLAPNAQAAPAPSQRPEPAPRQAAKPMPAKMPVPAKPQPAPPVPSAANSRPAVAKTSPPPRSEARPAQQASTAPQSMTAAAQPSGAPVAKPSAPISTAPAPALTPVVSLRPSFVSPPPPPRYPSQARRRNQQGIVRVEVSLDERGQQLKLKLVRSSGVDSLDQAALEAVTQWRFRPEIVGGRAVPSRVEIPIEFALTANR